MYGYVTWEISIFGIVENPTSLIGDPVALAYVFSFGTALVS